MRHLPNLRLLALAGTLLFLLSGCGPTICDCKDALTNAAGRVIDNALQGESTDLTEVKETTRQCQEKYGDLPASEIVEELKKCQ